MLVYFCVVGAFTLLKMALLFGPESEADVDLNFIREVGKLSPFLGPFFVSVFLAIRIRRTLTETEPKTVAGWCILIEIATDVLGFAYLTAASALGATGLPELDRSAIQAIALFLAFRNAFNYLVIWFLLRFPAKWLAGAWLRRAGAAA